MLDDFGPIAISSVFCKTMERVLASHLTSCAADTLQSWCKISNLEISVDKTEEMSICSERDFTTEPAAFCSQRVETVNSWYSPGLPVDVYFPEMHTRASLS